jgi:hypothetical protein
MVTKLGPLCKVKLLNNQGDKLVVRSPEKAVVGGNSPRPPCSQWVGNFVPGVFTPVLAKHSKSFSLIDCASVVWTGCSGTLSRCASKWKVWQKKEVTSVTVKVVIYEPFVEGQLEASKHLARNVQ